MNNFTCFVAGSIFGAYVAQNYEIPDVKKKIDELQKYLNSIEKK
tara:strand:- start:1102 stop:1233 length:132 start_codon:yes stop_codon:yes gene_type:complete